MPAEYNFEFVKNEIIPSFPDFILWGKMVQIRSLKPKVRGIQIVVE